MSHVLQPLRPVHSLVHALPTEMFMSRCLNKATLIGYLGADPEIRTVSSGARFAQLSIGTTRRWSDREGNLREKTQWHRVLVWDSIPATFAFVEKYLRKGGRVYVEGEIDYRSYETAKGDTRWTTEIKASEVLAAGDTRGRDEQRGGRSTRSRATAAQAELQLVAL
jgi:single-strand DNA-binding protein